MIFIGRKRAACRLSPYDEGGEGASGLAEGSSHQSSCSRGSTPRGTYAGGISTPLTTTVGRGTQRARLAGKMCMSRPAMCASDAIGHLRLSGPAIYCTRRAQRRRTSRAVRAASPYRRAIKAENRGCALMPYVAVTVDWARAIKAARVLTVRVSTPPYRWREKEDLWRTTREHT